MTTSQSAEALPCHCGHVLTINQGQHLKSCPAFYRPAVAQALQGLMDERDFQGRVQPWMSACFTPEICADGVERGDRLVEEVFELLQSEGYDPARIPALRDYVWARPVGEPSQEVGGVMVTLAAFCLAHDLDMHAAGETELARIWTKVEKIRAKQASKPTGSALPIPIDDPLSSLRDKIAALEADLERAKGLKREAADSYELAIRRFWSVDDVPPKPPFCGECKADYPAHRPDCTVTKLRAASGGGEKG